MICIEIELFNFLSHNKCTKFIGISAKMQELEDVESNEAEPSGDLVICVRGFLGCIERKAYDWPEDDWPKTDSLAHKARKCYLNFQACSGSAMLIPDRNDSPQVRICTLLYTYFTYLILK